MEEQNHIQKRAKKGWAFYVVYSLILSVLILLVLGGSFFFYHSHRLPDFAPLKDRNLNAFSIVYSEEDEVVGKYLMENRIPISYERIPKQLVNAFVAAEDADFFKHKGVDYKGILRAMFKNLLAGRIVQGGSTITQQVTKTFFLTPKRSLTRKLKEVAYAFGLEQNLTKEEILGLYLNNIYLGNGAYGVEAAADSYFNKHVEHLTLPEMAMLAGLVKAPSRYSPVNNLKGPKIDKPMSSPVWLNWASSRKNRGKKPSGFPLKFSRGKVLISAGPRTSPSSFDTRWRGSMGRKNCTRKG